MTPTFWQWCAIWSWKWIFHSFDFHCGLQFKNNVMQVRGGVKTFGTLSLIKKRAIVAWQREKRGSNLRQACVLMVYCGLNNNTFKLFLKGHMLLGFESWSSRAGCPPMHFCHRCETVCDIVAASFATLQIHTSQTSAKVGQKNGIFASPSLAADRWIEPGSAA